ncbi:MAG: polysaccharide deacetylase family protein [Planctomycetes bacterium]|nr:polysaccharide deacetylase family protein [Planctomycetota bacterium]
MNVPVFYYHRIGPFREGAPRRLNAAPEAFREHMQVLARRARPASLDTLVDWVRSGRPIPRGTAAVTFDDGYRHVLEYALPTLKEFGIPATFFIVTGGVGADDSWNDGSRVPRERILSWDELARIVAEGHAIGSHTCSHAVLEGMAEDRLRREIFESKKILEERLGIPVRHFAYPQGRFSLEAERLVREAGYAAGWATRKGKPLSNDDLTAVRRVPVSSWIRGPRFRWELFLMKWGLR